MVMANALGGQMCNIPTHNSQDVLSLILLIKWYFCSMAGCTGEQEFRIYSKKKVQTHI